VQRNLGLAEVAKDGSVFKRRFLTERRGLEAKKAKKGHERL